jgi:hypothetical protein
MICSAGDAKLVEVSSLSEVEIMISKPCLSVILLMTIFLVAVFPVVAQSPAEDDIGLKQTFDLAGQRSKETQYYLMESTLVEYALNGDRTNSDTYRLRLKCVPGEKAGWDGDKYTCVRFTLQQGDAAEVSIPTLEGWTYIFTDGIDDKGQVFGIDHGKFESLIDANGNALPPGKVYHVYNAFIDFHSFCNVFAERPAEGNGIQDLKEIGQEVVHAAAFSEPPVSLGSNVGEGSVFRNGRITLEFKGLSLVNGRRCALLEYDSGESSFEMVMKPTPDMEIQTVGSSHYKGDIYKDLSTSWVQKVTMTEFVISETTLPIPPDRVNSIVERSILILNVGRNEPDSD